MAENEKNKKCESCSRVKKKIYFYFNYQNPDNRSNVCIKCHKAVKALKEKDRKRKIFNDSRRIAGRKTLVLYKRKSSELAQSVYEADPTPIFMQYNHIIYKYCKEKHGLNQESVNLLLFMFPISPFSRREFIDSRSALNLKSPTFMKLFTDKGIISVFRKSDKMDRTPTLFGFTDKGNSLISDIHLWSLGKKELPQVSVDDSAELLGLIMNRKKRKAP